MDIGYFEKLLNYEDPNEESQKIDEILNEY